MKFIKRNVRDAEKAGIVSVYKVFDSGLELGEVRRIQWTGVTGTSYDKWLAWDAHGNRVGIWFATRRSAGSALLTHNNTPQRRAL